MKIFVLCDERGDVESFVIPNPQLAARVGLEAPTGGRVHVLDVDSRVLTREDLLNPKDTDARKKVYDKLRGMIASAGDPRSGRRTKR
jgi:hypothetical protein